jgi:hypothetical protein
MMTFAVKIFIAFFAAGLDDLWFFKRRQPSAFFLARDGTARR